ncbi:hypothetical protein PILCRDRAFT_669014 [Piloderma croceum F 1598]|uniref:Uncharacterized protein n=1 Tax=Piloderma croceum (strain F 1598) TaxID=765440 RepID=A0A0C3BEB6_PILCF|nr:hypothetical protein PILCRDRAFT_669014 [Piloderma croceum F 1598]
MSNSLSIIAMLQRKHPSSSMSRFHLFFLWYLGAIGHRSCSSRRQREWTSGCFLHFPHLDRAHIRFI